MTALAAIGTAVTFLLGIRWAYNAGLDHGTESALLNLVADAHEPEPEPEQPLPVYGNGDRSTTTRRPA